MTARVALDEATDSKLLVPLNAVTDTGNGPQVWVVSDGKAMPRPVRIAGYREDGASISSGLQAGEQIIITGTGKLAPGQAVQPKLAASPTEQR